MNIEINIMLVCLLKINTYNLKYRMRSATFFIHICGSRLSISFALKELTKCNISQLENTIIYLTYFELQKKRYM